MRSDAQGCRESASAYRVFAACWRETGTVAPREEELRALSPDLGGRPPLPEPPADARSALRGLFGHNLSPDCPPYETQYGKVGAFRQSQILADLSGFYRAWGVDTTDGNRRPDHLPIELEFASLLCLKEAHALAEGKSAQAQLAGRARARFLAEHLAVWSGAFAEAVERKAPGGYHAALAAATDEFVRAESRFLGAPPVGRAGAVRFGEPEDHCASCFGGIDAANP